MNISDQQLFHIQTYGEGEPKVLIELPHGATKTEEYDFFARKIPSLPKDLIEFFYVNTDVGTPELAVSIAEHLKETCAITIIRSRIPRTLVDCNRVLSLSKEQYREGKVTAGIPCYIPEQDHQWLRAVHERYTQKVEERYARICGNGGSAFILHSYAPKSVGIASVEHDIVEKLHWAYEKKQYDKWPVRPEVDIIGKMKDGTWMCDINLVERLKSSFSNHDITVGLSQTYPLHPSTMAYHHALRYPGQTICLELRRDLLMKAFVPFVPMQACQDKIQQHAHAIVDAFTEKS